MDIRLKTIPLEFDGETYQLTVNMNVLADVQEENGGDLQAVLSEKGVLTGLLAFLSAAINEAADAKGLQKRYTPRQVGRLLTPKQFFALQKPMMELVSAALGPGAPEDPSETEEDAAKNPETTQP